MDNLPQPPIDTKTIELKNIFDVEELQHLQDLFSDATGVASIITTPEGIPITRPSNFSKLCQDIIRKTKIGQQNCYKSDAILGAQNLAGSVIQNCHSCGLWDAGASIIVGGHHIASWLIGQIRNPETRVEELLNYADEIGVDRIEYEKALLQVPMMSADKFKRISEMLFLYANELSNKAYNNLLLKSKVKELEQTIKLVNQSEDRFQSLFHEAPLGYQSLDSEGNILNVNQRWVEIIGYAAQEVIGKWFGDFLAEKHVEDFPHRFAQFKEKGAIHSEFIVIHKNGQQLIIAFDGKVAYHPDGTFKQTHCILKDITKQVQAEEALRASEERYKTILKTAMNGFWILDSKGIIKEVNASYCVMSGYSENELIGMNISELDIDETLEDVEAHIAKIESRGEDRFEAFHRRKDGSIFNVEINVQQISAQPTNFLVVFIHDITKRKNTEQKLQQTTQTYIDLFNTISEAIYIQDENGSFIEVNKGAEILYQLSKEELIGQSPLSVAAPGLNNLEEIGRISKEVFLTGIPAHFDFWAVRKNGEIFPKNVIVNKGKYFGKDVLIATARDITLQKLDEQTIRESEEKFRMIFDESPVGIELYSAEGVQINANQASLDMFGIPDISEIFNFNLFDGTSLNADLKEKLSNGIAVNYQSAFDFNKVRELNQYATHRQGIAYFEYHIKPLFNQETKAISGYLCHISDITKRIEAEKENSLLAHSLESVNECVSITDLNNILIYVNKAFLKTYGYEKEELIGRNIGMVGSTKNTPSYLNDILSSTIQQGWLGELVNKTKNGKEFPILLSTSHIKDNNGQTIGLIGVAKDITQRKKHELELVEAKKRAEESDRLKSAFLANMSHEIRTPMNGILGFTELLKKPMLTGEKQKKYIDIIDKSGQRMLNVINDIISISKVEAGQMELVKVKTHIDEQLDYLYNFFKPEATKKGVDLLVYNGLDKSEYIIFSDKEKIYAILTNLLKNAIKFTQSGFIKFGCERNDKFITFFVTDTGTGILEEQKQIIFERFRQGSESLTRNYEGAGLGLSICKAYVEMLGGRIWVENNAEAGSTFFFTIPFDRSTFYQETTQKATMVDRKETQVKRLKVLIVEDDPTSEWLIKLLIEKYSRDILVANNGFDAINICKTHSDIDLILMDVKMGKMDGYQTTNKIREFNQQVIIIAQTAYALTGDREKALNAGCNDYITKPINADNLFDLLAKYF